MALLILCLLILSNCDNATTESASNRVPDSPTNLSIASTGLNDNHLLWKDNSDNEEGFYVERSVNDSSHFSILDSVQKNLVAFIDTGLVQGTQFFYRIRAYNEHGLSEYSNTIGAMTLGPSISITPEYSSIGIGESIELIIQIDNISTPVYGISIRIAYDSDIVDFDANNFMLGNLFNSNAIAFAQVSGSIAYLMITMTDNQAYFSGSGEVGVVTFIGLNSGLSSLSFIESDLLLYNSEGNIILIDGLKMKPAEIIVN